MKVFRERRGLAFRFRSTRDVWSRIFHIFTWICHLCQEITKKYYFVANFKLKYWDTGEMISCQYQEFVIISDRKVISSQLLLSLSVIGSIFNPFLNSNNFFAFFSCSATISARGGEWTSALSDKIIELSAVRFEKYPHHSGGGRPIGSGLGCKDPGSHALGYPRVELRAAFWAASPVPESRSGFWIFRAPPVEDGGGGDQGSMLKFRHQISQVFSAFQNPSYI